MPSSKDAEIIRELEEKMRRMGPKYIESRRADFEPFLQTAHIDFAKLALLCHKVKGSAKTYGHERLGDLARELEDKALASNLPDSEAILQQIKEYLRAEPTLLPDDKH